MEYTTASTRGLLDNKTLEACCAKSKNRAVVFMNAGRGDLLSEDSIIEAFNNGWISHAVLDVFPTEPLLKSSKLWDHPKCTLTPHVSGMSHPENIGSKNPLAVYHNY